MRRWILSLSLFLLLPLPGAAAPDSDFPVPTNLRPAVQFWKRVYLEATTDGGLLHDSRRLNVVYETIRFTPKASARSRSKLVDRRRKYWKGVLLRLARNTQPRTEDETKARDLLRDALGRVPQRKDYQAVARRIRFQLGQRNKFRAGLIRAGAYEDEMRDIFRGHGLPIDLALLPHVESSFNVHAYSTYGAAGAWQFMRSTGRRYMRVDYVVDERLDPIVATDAAARLLKSNYSLLKAWPLAITAYNHGAAGMRRAVRKLGTRDMGVIAERYKSRSFGFASRNFYAQFLAARLVAKNYEAHFGPLRRDTPEPVDTVILPYFVDASDLERHLGLSPEVLEQYNPALRPPVFRGAKRIPKGFVLRLPAGTTGDDSETWLAALPGGKRHAEQHRLRYYQVRRGDTLSTIARRNKTSISALVAHNNLPSRHRIYVGQVLELPGSPAKPRKTSLIRSANAATRDETPKAAARPQPKAEAKPKPEPKVEPKVAPPPPTQTVAVPDPKPAPTPKTPTAAPKKPKAPLEDAVAERSPSRALPGAIPPGAKPSNKPPSQTIPEDSPWRRVNGNWVLVDVDETLGHFAEWLELPASRLRKLNRISSRAKLRMGQRLKLDFSRVKPDEFLERRMEFHKGIEEDFLGTYRITGTVEHTLQRGDSLWLLSHKRFRVPVWLLRRYNPDVDLLELSPGSTLVIPEVEAIQAG